MGREINKALTAIAIWVMNVAMAAGVGVLIWKMFLIPMGLPEISFPEAAGIVVLLKVLVSPPELETEGEVPIGLIVIPLAVFYTTTLVIAAMFKVLENYG